MANIDQLKPIKTRFPSFGSHQSQIYIFAHLNTQIFLSISITIILITIFAGNIPSCKQVAALESPHTLNMLGNESPVYIQGGP